MIRRPPTTTLFPNTTLFRSVWAIYNKKHCNYDDYLIMNDVRYSKRFNACVYDLFVKKLDPENPKPVIIFIHGGGWRGGTKEMWHYYCCKAAEAGYVAVCANYPLVPDTNYIRQLAEIKCLVNHLCESRREYCIDEERFVLAGDSAGGHLTALYVNEYNAKYAVKCKVCISAPLDFSTKQNKIVEDMIKDMLGDKSRLQASPIHNIKIRNKDYQDYDYTLPTLLIHGKDDILVPHYHSVNYAKALQKLDMVGELHIIGGAKHEFQLKVDTIQSVAFWNILLQFITEHNQLPKSKEDKSS